MTINYLMIGGVILLVLLILAFAVYKNQKDKNKLIETLNKGELKTERHNEGEDQ
jgi:hypothetical protein